MCGCSCCGMVAMQQQRGCTSRVTCKHEKPGRALPACPAPPRQASGPGGTPLVADFHAVLVLEALRGAQRAQLQRAAHACIGARRQRGSALCAAPPSTSAWAELAAQAGQGSTCMRDGGQAAPPMQTMRRYVRRCRVASRCCSRPRQTVGTACARVLCPCIPLICIVSRQSCKLYNSKAFGA